MHVQNPSKIQERVFNTGMWGGELLSHRKCIQMIVSFVQCTKEMGNIRYT